MSQLLGFLFLICSILFGVCHSADPCQAPIPTSCNCPSGKVSCSLDTITDIPAFIPKNTTSLDLTECRITRLTNESFKNLKSLEEIDISSQKGGSLSIEDSGVFQGLENLTRIILNDNIIKSLPSGLFANLPKLRLVNLNNNPVTKFQDNLFENSTMLGFLSIGSTQLDSATLTKIGQGHFGKNIKALGLTGTRIQTLTNKFFSGLPQLKALLLGECQIENIGADAFSGTKITTLELGPNPIKKIDANAFRGAAITTFRCPNCLLTSERVFGFLKNMKSLSHLDLQNNNLTYIKKDSFTGLAALADIKLKNNSIKMIEENPFADLTLCNIDPNCIDLSENPLKCDCKLSWFKNWAEAKKIDQNLLKCQSPSTVVGKSFAQLKVNQFCCSDGNKTSCGESGGTNPSSRPTSGQQVVQGYLILVLLAFALLPFYNFL